MIRQGQGGGHRVRLSQTTLVGGTSTSIKNNSTPTLREPSRLRTNSSSGTGTTLREHSCSRTGLLSGTGTRLQRPALSPTTPSTVLITLIPSKERLSQFDLHGHNQQAEDNHVFGDAYPKSPAPNSSLFTFQNISPQKQSASHSASKFNSRRFSLGRASVSLFAEHCLNEAKLPHCDTFNARMKVNSLSSFSYILNNNHEATSSSWHLVGGTGFTMCSLVCSHKLNHGGDSTGLGQWSFTRFQGRGDTTLCVYAAYCPVKNPRNPGSVWNQQCRFFSDTRDDPNPNPRTLFAQDLCRSILARMAAGDSVILH